MTGTFLLAMAARGSMDAATLRGFVQRQNERRRQILSKAADLVFGFLMFLFGDLRITVQTGGRVLDAASPEVTSDQKLSAILAAMKSTNKALLFRELVRPLLKSAAELLADALGIDETTLALMAARPALPAPLPAAPAPAPAPTQPAPAPAQPAAQPKGDPRYEGQLLQADNGNSTVWHIVGGKRRGIQAPDVMRERYGAQVVNGRWTHVTYVPQRVIDAYPLGTPEPSRYEGKLLQANDGSATVWHIVNGQRRGITGPSVMNRKFGSTFQNGRWSKVVYVPPAVINDFPVGATES